MSGGACKLLICGHDFAAPGKGIEEFASLVVSGAIEETADIDSLLHESAKIQANAAFELHDCLSKLRKLSGT